MPDELHIYNASGQLVTVENDGPSDPGAVAADSHGKIYVANMMGTIDTFTASGTPTTPFISGMGLARPTGIVVDANGTIYVANYNGAMTTYNPDGTPASLSINNSPGTGAVALDRAGNIYLGSSQTDLTTVYSSGGVPTGQTFSGGTSIGVGPDGNIHTVGFDPTNPLGTGVISTYLPNGTLVSSSTISKTSIESFYVGSNGQLYTMTGGYAAPYGTGWGLIAGVYIPFAPFGFAIY